MKPKRIILVRHGQSESNIDHSKYSEKPDFAMNLSIEGREQAARLGIELKELIKDETVIFYRSPFYRTRQTQAIIGKLFPSAVVKEEVRIREQEHHSRIQSGPDNRDETEKERDEYGHFYYRFEGGESCADAYDRISDFLGTLFRDFEKPDFGENCVIVGHGMTNRVFLMRFLHYTVEEFEYLRNPKNCGIYILELQENGKYKLNKEPEKYEKRNCIY